MTQRHFNNRQLAHVWAQQTQSSGSGSNFFFDGPSIYSYGRHFEIARFITRKGRRAVLFRAGGYSVTTSKHQGFVRNALPGGTPVFTVGNLDDAARGADSVRDTYRANIAAALSASVNARSAASIARNMQEAQRLAREANDYAQFFGKRWRVPVPAHNAEALAALKEQAKRTAARERAAIRKRNAERAALIAQHIQEWRNFEREYLAYFDAPVALRINQAGNRIETSKGAHVPLDVAPMVWGMVQATRASGAPWFAEYAARPRIGDFTLDRIEACGDIVAGCHTIPYAELCRIARELGYEGVQP